MKKRSITRMLLSLCVALAMCIALAVPGFAATTKAANGLFAGGSGTKTDPYEIANVEQLLAINTDLGASYELVADIDFSGVSAWLPIGYYSIDIAAMMNGSEEVPEALAFHGTFDGNGHTMKNLSIVTVNPMAAGVFGFTAGNAYLHDINIENFSTKGILCCGSLVGWASGKTLIENVTVKNANNRGMSMVGALTGSSNGDVTVKNVKVNGGSAVCGYSLLDGNIELLAGYGITEETMGCEIRSSMEVVELGLSERGKPVFMDKNAYESDGVILSCRLKPHNAFRGPVESGPCKMMTVGLGKQRGAEQVHSDGMDNIAKNIPTMAKVTLASGKILFAIPCLENAYDQTMMFEAILPERILEREPELLKIAFANMPSILVGSGDVLIVDRIGKNFSGTGVDPNITGTFSTPYASGGVQVQRTCFLDLSPESHGNALGIGLASCITRRIFDQIDTDAMYTNCLTSTVIKSAMVPCVMNDDLEAIRFCLHTCNRIDRANPRIIRIRNSLHLGEVMLSGAYYADVLDGRYEGLTALDAPQPLTFESGALTTGWLQ